MRSATPFLLLAWMAGCTPELPARPDAGGADGGLAFLPERHTEFAFAATRESPDGGADGLPLGSRALEADAGAAPATLPLLTAEAVLPDGSARALSREGVTAIDPSARFRLEVAARLLEARLSLLDAQDAMVASDGTTEASASTRFALTPAAPLRAGSSYTLRLDGAGGRLLRAEDGRSFEPVSLSLRTSGETPAPPRKAKRRRSR